MPWFAFLVLILWLPVVFYLFERYSIQKAIVFSFVSAWLFLPPTQIPLPGFPDWSKMTATVTSVTICAWLKQSNRLLGLRPRWYDLPVIGYCAIPLAASIHNGLGAYDGFSGSLDEIFRWGLPYMIGRAYLADAGGNRQLCLGIAAGGLLYVPFCLFEIRMSPMTKAYVYGFGGDSAVAFGLRYGGYRPMVFLANGLELGWWMCCATLAAYVLWVSGAVKRLQGYPMGGMVVVLTLVTVACKSTGALIQLILGMVLIYASRFFKSAVLVWALMVIPPVYCITRPLGIWTGEAVVSYATALFGAERAQSLEFRFVNEEVLMRSAMQRPLFGWGRTGGFNPPDDYGNSAVTDGLWIIVFGWMGFGGLATLNAMMLIPTARYIYRCRPKHWLDPELAPVTTLAIILPLFMLDNLSNAMLNPIYAIAMGSLAGFNLPARNSRTGAIRDDRRSEGESPFEPIEPPGNRAIRADSPRDLAADRLEMEAREAAQLGYSREAGDLFERAIQSRQLAVQCQQTPTRLDQLAQTHAIHARLLTSTGQISAAIQERERALAVWQGLLQADPRAEYAQDLYAANLNDLAWLLIADLTPAAADVDRSVALASEAVQLAAGHAPFWNTLGIALYRRLDHYKAVHALSRSVSLSPEGGNSFDFYYLALANHALGYAKPAAEWLARAEAWSARHPELDPVVGKVQAEALETMGRKSLT